jgi:Flp pilus assembly pilin Flp
LISDLAGGVAATLAWRRASGPPLDRPRRRIFRQFVGVSSVKLALWQEGLSNGFHWGVSTLVNPMLHPVKRFANDDSGGTSIEYVLIAIGIAIGIAMVVASLGSFVPYR